MPSAALPVLTERGDVWQGRAWGRAEAGVLPSRDQALDAQLPGGGWPAAGLTELLQPPRPLGACNAWRLLVPALATLAAQGVAAGPLVLIGAPGSLHPFAPALAAQGLPAGRLLWVRVEDDMARLWACEQAVRCADVPAVLAWLPRARVDGLRRLHLAALDHGRPLFALRPAAAQRESSPAPLRLLVEGGESLQVRVFKRRGPPMEQPLAVSGHGSQLAALLAMRPLRTDPPRSAVEQPAEVQPLRADAANPLVEKGSRHGLDRTVAA